METLRRRNNMAVVRPVLDSRCYAKATNYGLSIMSLGGQDVFVVYAQGGLGRAYIAFLTEPSSDPQKPYFFPTYLTVGDEFREISGACLDFRKYAQMKGPNDPLGLPEDYKKVASSNNSNPFAPLWGPGAPIQPNPGNAVPTPTSNAVDAAWLKAMLTKYGRHSQRCDTGVACTCGFAQVEKELGI